MTRLAQLALVLTSLAPIALVQAAVYAQRQAWVYASSLALAAGLMVPLAHLLFYGLRTSTAAVPKDVADLKRLDSEPLAFLVSYALPLIAAKVNERSEYALITYAFLMGLVLWQQQMFQVNPLLAATGYSFLTCSVGGAPVLLITNVSIPHTGTLMLYPLSERVWLHLGAEQKPATGGVGGLSTSDPKGSFDSGA